MKIVWDQKKSILNFRKHGVYFSDAATALDDPAAITIEDVDHEEQRFITIGMDIQMHVLVVVFTYRDEDTIRLISARPATKKERVIYEKRI